MQFSVLLPVYHADHAAHLELALASLIDQTVQPDEIVLVEDGPVPGDLSAVIDGFEARAGNRLKRIRLDQNYGLVRALNTGLDHCSFDLVARMDSDDLCVPDRFERQLAFFEANPEYSLVGGMLEEFMETRGDMGRFKTLPLTHEEILAWSKKRCPFNHPSVMYRKPVIASLGGYRQFSNFEDYYLWVKLLHAGHKAANLPDVLVHYRLGPDFVKRRKGLRYFFREYALLKELRRMRFLNRSQFILNIARRLPLRVMPGFIVKWVYRYYLRR
jgi:glycosyltransferase involved in cell wall biosynthesis